MDDLGKKAESKIREWLDKPEDGYSFNRIPDQMTGQFGSKNICDFICYKYPFMYYIESKATWNDRWEFNQLTDTQYDGLLAKSKISGCYGVIIVLFASYKRAFAFHIEDIDTYIKTYGKKSLNISKIDRWQIPYKEIATIPNSRKTYLDYFGELHSYM